jgi:hypothetical protein
MPAGTIATAAAAAVRGVRAARRTRIVLLETSSASS